MFVGDDEVIMSYNIVAPAVSQLLISPVKFAGRRYLM